MPSRIKFAGDRRPESPFRTIRTGDKKERDKFYGSKRWRDLRLAHLRESPLCVECLKLGRVVEADTVHHVKERLESPELAYERTNLESSCSPCHTQRHKLKREANAPLSPHAGDPRGDRLERPADQEPYSADECW